MKISKFLILFVSLICILASCSNSKDDTVSVIKHGRSLEYRIHTQEINDSLQLKLSDFVTDFEFIPLETKEECLVSWGGDYYLGEQYYLIEKKGDGILQFNRDGKFIRKIVDVGQGPQEFVDGFWSVDEKNQILYIADEAKRNYFLSFDLFTGAYLGDIPKAVSCRTPQIYSLPNGSILVSTKGNYDKDGLTSIVFCQDSNGNLLNSIESNAESPVFWSKLTRSNTEQLYSLKMVNNDTIYQILDYAEKALANPEFKEPYRSKLKNAVDGLTAEANPVLLIGRYK